MIINIFPYGLKHALGNHDDHVMPNTITEYGADFVCRKCFRKVYFAWQTNMQVINAKVYLTVKSSAVLANRLFKKEQ